MQPTLKCMVRAGRLPLKLAGRSMHEHRRSWVPGVSVARLPPPSTPFTHLSAHTQLISPCGEQVAPLLATADEVAAGVIPHAMRFSLPNDMLQHGVYAHPATHAGVPIKPPPAPAGGPDP